MFTDPTAFLIVAIITALAIIGLFGVLIGASIRYGIGEEDDQADVIPIRSDRSWASVVREWERTHPEDAA